MSATCDSGVHDVITDSDAGILIVNHSLAGGRTASNRRFSHSAADQKSRRLTLDIREIRRRFCHILPGFLPMLLWLIPHKDPLSWRARIGVVLLIATLATGILSRFRTIGRSPADERGRFGAVMGYALPIALMVLCIPAHIELAFLVLAMIAFGDGMATVGGLCIGGPRLPWNSAKTWAGFASFIMSAATMGSLIYWCEASPQVPIASVLPLAAVSAVFSALSESIPSRINDNIRVGISASLGAVFSQWLFVGF